jgi:hypothetical protein
MSELMFHGRGALAMQNRTDRANRYRRKVSEFPELASSDPPDMIGDVHRELAVRYIRMAQDLARREKEPTTSLTPLNKQEYGGSYLRCYGAFFRALLRPRIWKSLGLHHPKSIAGMFGWLKSKERKKAETVVALLAQAIKEVHPKRYIDPWERASVKNRKLSQLNLLLGREESERSAAIAFDDLVAMTSDYERKGYARELDTVVAHDAVLIALVAAAKHERRGRAMRDEVRERAKQLLRYVNPSATSSSPAVALEKPPLSRHPRR